MICWPWSVIEDGQLYAAVDVDEGGYSEADIAARTAARRKAFKGAVSPSRVDVKPILHAENQAVINHSVGALGCLNGRSDYQPPVILP